MPYTLVYKEQRNQVEWSQDYDNTKKEARSTPAPDFNIVLFDYKYRTSFVLTRCVETQP